MADLHRVVIVGGGFGGLYSALALGRQPVQVTLIDRRNFHLFQPLLYQVATGGLSPGDITAPLRSVLRKQKNTAVLMAECTGFDVPGRRVLLGDEAIAYDSLIVAAGAENHYFGNDGWSAAAPGLKTIEDATEMRARILSAFEQAEREADAVKRRAWLRFVVVGAGPTGVELAGTLGEIARDTLKDDFRRIRPEESEILLIEGGDRALPQFVEELSAKAERELIGLGVRTRTKVRVTAIDATGVTLNGPRGEERIESFTVLWAAGVRPSGLGRQLAQALGAETDRAGRVVIGQDLSVPSHPNIYVLGDLAHQEQDGAVLPGLAAVAMQQGQHVGKVIAARLANRPAPAFRYVDKGTLATIGRHAAVAQFGRVKLTGSIAWLAWLFIHLLLLVGFRNRVLVATQWAFQYFTFNRGARLITRKGTA
jgi:NADH dehydrogenase